MVYSLCDLLICTDDTFLALFGCFCLWSCFYKPLHDLTCLKELLEDFRRRQDMFLRSSLFSRFHVICWPCCGVKRVADTFVEVSLVLEFLSLAETNTADCTLCKYL